MLGHRKLEVPEYLSILKRHWLIIALPTLVLTAVGFGLTYVIPPEYLSKTLVIIETQKVADDLVKPVVANDLDQQLASMTEQILSRSRLQPIIDRYNLYANQHLTPDEKMELARKKIEVKPIHSEISKAKGLPGFNIIFKNSDAHTAQLVCGEITSLFISEDLKENEEQNQGTADFLKGQLEDAKKSLDEQDEKLADFQRQYIGKLPGEENSNVTMLTSMNTQLEAVTEALSRMEQDKSYAETNLAQQTANAAAGASIASSPTGLPPSVAPSGPSPQQTELLALERQEADLTAHYTDDYPDVVQIRRKIADLRQEIARNPAPPMSTAAQVAAQSKSPDSLGIQEMQGRIHALDIGIDQKKRQQAELQNSIKTYQDRIASSPLVQEQYKELTRDYQTAQTFYNSLLAQMNRAKMATDLERRQEGEQFVILDQPNLPDTPEFPKPVLFTVGGLGAGLLLGLGIVAILEYKDTALATERDIWEFTRLPTLAVIGFISKDEQSESRKRGFFARLNPFSRKQQPVAQS
jgi:polysaccharide chain length determinant protein (PEP-CTERM system associated)